MMQPIVYLPKTPTNEHQVIGIVGGTPITITTYLYSHPELRDYQVNIIATPTSAKEFKWRQVVMLFDWRKLVDYELIYNYLIEQDYTKQEDQ